MASPLTVRGQGRAGLAACWAESNTAGTRAAMLCTWERQVATERALTSPIADVALLSAPTHPPPAADPNNGCDLNAISNPDNVAIAAEVRWGSCSGGVMQPSPSTACRACAQHEHTSQPA